MRKRGYWGWRRVVACLMTTAMTVTLPGVPALGAVENGEAEGILEENQTEEVEEKLLKATPTDAPFEEEEPETEESQKEPETEEDLEESEEDNQEEMDVEENETEAPVEEVTEPDAGGISGVEMPFEEWKTLRATPTEVAVFAVEDTFPLQLYHNGTWKSYSGSVADDEKLGKCLTVTEITERNYEITLNGDVDGYTLKITGGAWKINLNDHTWNRTNDERARLAVQSAHVTIQNGTFNYAMDQGFDEDNFSNSTVTFENVKAKISRLMLDNTTFIVNGGSIKSSGKGSQQFLVWNESAVQISNADIELEQVTVSKASTSITIDNSTFRSEYLDLTGEQSKVTIKGKKSDVSAGSICLNGSCSKLEVEYGKFTIRSKSYLSSSIGSINIRSGATFQVDGDISSLSANQLTIESGATVTGTGKIPESKRLPMTVSAKTDAPAIKADTLIQVADYLQSDPATTNLTCQVVEAVKGIEMPNDGKDGMIRVKRTGEVWINVVAGNGIYQSVKTTISLQVKANQWDPSLFRIETCQDIYDGKPHVLIQNVTYNDEPYLDRVDIYYMTDGGATYEKVTAENGPFAVNVSDNQKRYDLILVDRRGLYERVGFQEFYYPRIQPRDLSDPEQVTITLPPEYTEDNGPIYNGEDQTPSVIVSYESDSTPILLKEGTDYILERENWDKPVSECVDASREYSLLVKASGKNANFTGSRKINFQIMQKAVSFKGIEKVTKVYDGTSDAPAGFTLELDENSILECDRGKVGFETDLPRKPQFLSANAGETMFLLTGYGLTGERRENYTYYAMPAVIEPAEITDISVTQTNHLTYTGEPQRLTVKTTASTVKPADQPDANVPAFYYSLDGEADTSTYQSEVPAVTEVGTKVYYVVRAENHKESPKAYFIVDMEKGNQENPDDNQGGNSGGNAGENTGGSGNDNAGGNTSGSDGGSTGGSTGGSDSGSTGGSNSSSSGGTSNGNGSGSGSSSGSSRRDSSDRIDNAENRRLGNVTWDPKKGCISSKLGIVTGVYDKRGGDGYSHWIKDEKGWWLCYNDGTYAKATRQSQSSDAAQAPISTEKIYFWEMVDGQWYAFDEEGYMVTGWIFHKNQWYYLDPDGRMHTGWLKLNEKTYYLDPSTGAWVEN